MSVVAAPLRHAGLDALRGWAMMAMLLYHGAFDLVYFGWWHANPYRDIGWVVARTCILSSFLLCVGLSFALRDWRVDDPHAQRAEWRRFGMRWAQIVAAALLVSFGSRVVFEQSYITFGVLHGVALMLLLLCLTRTLGAWQLWLAFLALVLWLSWRHPIFDSRWTNWVGLVTHKPITEDYVPLLPWICVVWLGAVLGRAQRFLTTLNRLPAPRLLRALSRWPLTFYLVHQPVLFGLGWALQRAGWGLA